MSTTLHAPDEPTAQAARPAASTAADAALCGTPAPPSATSASAARPGADSPRATIATRPSGGVNRRRVAAPLKRASDGGHRLRTNLGGGVVVEIDRRAHAALAELPSRSPERTSARETAAK